MKKYVLTLILLLSCYTAQSHSGRTDSNGGHYNRKTGTYHYHNGGGLKTASKNYRSSQSYDSDLKVIQEKLNKLGFDCGDPDGVMGMKTTQAIKDFQRSSGLIPDGVIGQKTIKSLNAKI